MNEIKVKKYVKKPIPIEVMKYEEESIIEWMGDKGAIDYVGRLVIETPEGAVTCKKGDYVAKGVMGEFYPIRKDIFKKTYIEVTEEVDDV